MTACLRVLSVGVLACSPKLLRTGECAALAVLGNGHLYFCSGCARVPNSTGLASFRALPVPLRPCPPTSCVGNGIFLDNSYFRVHLSFPIPQLPTTCTFPTSTANCLVSKIILFIHPCLTHAGCVSCCYFARRRRCATPRHREYRAP